MIMQIVDFHFKSLQVTLQKNLQSQITITRTSIYQYSIIHLIHYPLHQSVISMALVVPPPMQIQAELCTSLTVLLLTAVLKTRIKEKLTKEKIGYI